MICVVAALGASPFLPPLLRFDNGSRVATPHAWLRTRRPQVSALAQDILLGRVPDSVPALVGARTINTTRTASSTSSFVNLTFAVVGARASVSVSFTIELLVPAGAGAAPVFLTQWTHRPWAVAGAAHWRRLPGG